MKDNKELVSALVDGEETHPDTLKKLLNEQSLQDAWQRYHLIKDTMQADDTAPLPLDFSQQVMQAIESEPTVASPSSVPSNLRKTGAKLVGTMRNLAQYGIAATVAAAMVLGVQHFNQPQIDQTFSAAKVPIIPGVGGGMSPVSLDSSVQLAKPENDEMKQKRRLNHYLQDHRDTLKQRPVLETTPE